jgi:hypothetical protein
MRQQILGCVCVCVCVCARYAAALPKIWLLTVLISDFDKEHASSLRMI